MQKLLRGLVAASLLVLGLTATSPVRPAAAGPPIARSVATGTGGAIATVDPYASRIGMRVLRPVSYTHLTLPTTPYV